ncbi:MAG: aspartate racemase [Motiliproteus sp.]
MSLVIESARFAALVESVTDEDQVFYHPYDKRPDPVHDLVYVLPNINGDYWMKTVGLLGGMSWESTAGYYKAINEGVRNRLGGLHSAQIVMFSVDFEPIEKMQHQGDWNGAALILSEAARKIELAGADFLLICTNTMHKIAPQIEQAVKIPILHIADATAEMLVKKGVKTVGLLGTAFTMEQEFYKGRLQEQYGLEVLVPDASDQQIVHDIIYNELCVGKVQSNSKLEYLRIINELAEQGAEAIILGCTEISMLVTQSDTTVALYDTTQIHADKAVEELL